MSKKISNPPPPPGRIKPEPPPCPPRPYDSAGSGYARRPFVDGRLDRWLEGLARGKPCLVRLPGCLQTSETVVLAHIRRGGIGGMGHKPPSLCGVYACRVCHDAIDGRAPLPATWDRDDLEQAVLLGLLRTLALVSEAMEQ